MKAPDFLELSGGVLIVAGVAFYAVPLALIVAGLFLVVAANAVATADPRVAVRRTARTGRRPRKAA